MEKNETSFSPGQMIWGVLLSLAGIGVFFRIPEVMPRVAQIQSLAGMTGWVRICFYLMGIILLAGGAQKIRKQSELLRVSRRRGSDGGNPEDPR
ncbi:MAG: hypothetical protein AB1921_07095 [Thermodesulfobacteriota bacterium]